MTKDPAVVLLSGGLDSTTCLAIAKQEFEPQALIFDYGQRHGVEVWCAQQIANRMGVAYKMVTLSGLQGGSVLTDPTAEVPKAGTEGIPPTYVPARNTIFLAHALAEAERIDAEDIFIGVSSVDYSGYPDCRPEFIAAFEQLANLATKAAVQDGAWFRVHAPLIEDSKAETILRGQALGVDYSITWSCYDPERTPVRPGATTWSYMPCGECDSCFLRAKAFKELGQPDPALARVGTPPE